jgi:hypothetical protein
VARLAAVVTVALLAGCGGRVSSDPADSGAAATSGDDASAEGGHTTTPFGLCPAEPPAVGDACVSPNQGCLYVYGGACLALVCDGSGHWVSASAGC